MEAVLTIAGSDSSGGAGIQADIKTITAHGLFAESVITALTAQNTTGVYGVEEVPAWFVEQQIDVVFSDIVPCAVKIGMVSTPKTVRAIAAGLVRNKARNIVLDPVMVATSGSSLIADAAVEALTEHLFAITDIITPNIPEAEVLAGCSIRTPADVELAAKTIASRVAQAVAGQGEASASARDGALDPTVDLTPGPTPGLALDSVAHSSIPAILIKGGHGVGDAAACNDYLLMPNGCGQWFEGQRIDNPNTHGTGCSLSSAIACGLAQGYSIQQAVSRGKAYITGALLAQLNMGIGAGPLDHMWEFR